MGISISWRPVKAGKHVPVNTPSSFWEGMREVFNTDIGQSIYLGEDERRSLIAMRAKDKSNSEAYDELIEAIEKHGSVEVFVE